MYTYIYIKKIYTCTQICYVEYIYIYIFGNVTLQIALNILRFPRF